jgi:FG-GAP-like repeat
MRRAWFAKIARYEARVGRARSTAAATLLGLVALLFADPPVIADGGVTFRDIAAGDGAGITYRRGRSVTDAAFDALKRQPAYTINDVFATRFKPRGAPGVALLDFDGDGDLDIFVTNGPGRCKSLYSNRLKETGKTTFVDVAMAAGVCAADMDATGVCFGDIDNDGFPDLLVLGRNEPNRLFHNQGNGTFVDITAQSGVGGGNLGHTSCAMGDINGDGLLDIVVANTFDWSTGRPIYVDPFAGIQHSQVYRNLGGNRFADVSAESGIQWSTTTMTVTPTSSLTAVLTLAPMWMPAIRAPSTRTKVARRVSNMTRPHSQDRPIIGAASYRAWQPATSMAADWSRYASRIDARGWSRG